MSWNNLHWPWSKPPKLRDHLGRDDKDFAVEFGGYLANAAERLLAVHEDAVRAEALLGKEAVAYDVIGDARDSLASAIYEFRKRAVKAILSRS